MITFYGISKLKKKYPEPVVAIGVYDGIHKGHQAVIRRTVSFARRIGGTAMLMTFDPHPLQVLKPHVGLPLIMSLEYRLKLIAALGIDVCLVIPFTRSFARLTPTKFIQKYLLEKISPRAVVVGDDFRFGQNRQGDLEEFQELGEKKGFSVLSIHSQAKGEKIFSSSAIRALITKGDLRKARQLLGRPYVLFGPVVHGDGRGQSLGFPTANIDTKGLVIPPQGVYVVKVDISGAIYGGVANIGTRPTFKSAAPVNVEVNVFECRKNLYGQNIGITFLKKIRDEKKFAGREVFLRQIKKDALYARQWLRKEWERVK